MGGNRLLLAAVLAAIFALVAGEMNEKIMKAYNNCKEKHNPPDGDMEKMKKKDLEHPYSKEAKCMVACMLEEGKILRNGKYNVGNAMIMSDVLHKDNAEDADKARKVIDACVKENPEVGSDECEFAYKMALCAGRESIKVGMNKTPDFFDP